MCSIAKQNIRTETTRPRRCFSNCRWCHAGFQVGSRRNSKNLLSREILAMQHYNTKGTLWLRVSSGDWNQRRDVRYERWRVINQKEMVMNQRTTNSSVAMINLSTLDSRQTDTSTSTVLRVPQFQSDEAATLQQVSMCRRAPPHARHVMWEREFYNLSRKRHSVVTIPRMTCT